jgi:hypothetical protein
MAAVFLSVCQWRALAEGAALCGFARLIIDESTVLATGIAAAGRAGSGD